MGWLEPLLGTVVGLDSAPLIYFIEEQAPYLPIVRPFFQALDLGQLSVVTSTVTLCEVLTAPLRDGDAELAQEYRDILLNSANVKTIDVTPDVAERAAQIRADFGLRTPDAIQVATALREGASALLSNDIKLRSLPVIKVILLRDLMATAP